MRWQHACLNLRSTVICRTLVRNMFNRFITLQEIVFASLSIVATPSASAAYSETLNSTCPDAIWGKKARSIMIRPIKYTLAQGAKEGTGNTRCAGAHLACRHVDAHRNYRRDREKETARDRRISLPLPGKDFKANMPQSTLHMQMNSMPQDLMDSSPLALLQRLQFAGRQIPLCSSHLCNKIRTVRHSIILIETAKGHANKQICTIQDVNGNARNHASRIIHTWLSNTKDAYFKTVRISRQFTTNSVK